MWETLNEPVEVKEPVGYEAVLEALDESLHDRLGEAVSAADGVAEPAEDTVDEYGTRAWG